MVDCEEIKEQYYNALTSIADQTDKTGREHGLSFCDGQPHASCIGDECEIPWSTYQEIAECPDGSIAELFVHTHTLAGGPDDPSPPSRADIEAGLDPHSSPKQCVIDTNHPGDAMYCWDSTPQEVENFNAEKFNAQLDYIEVVEETLSGDRTDLERRAKYFRENVGCVTSLANY